MHRFLPHLPLTTLRWSFAAKLAATLLLIAIGDLIFYQYEWHGGAFAIGALLLLGATVFLLPPIRTYRPASMGAMAAAIFAFALAFDSSFLAWTLFWIAINLAVLLPLMSKQADSWQWAQRLAYQSLRTIVAPSIDLNRIRRVRAARGLKFRRPNASNLLLPLFGATIIISLFAAANPVINNFLLALAIPQFDLHILGRTILWLLLGLLIWVTLRPRLYGRVFSTFDGRGDIYIPGVNPISVKLSLILFNGLFAIQNGLDVAFLWGGGQLPDGVTLAQYAHQGAYPLIATAILAGLFVLITLRPGSQTASDKLIRIMVILWIGQNLILVASSMLRTLDYIAIYSLTVLRISALLWMLLVAIGLFLILWRMLKGRSASWLINCNMLATACLLAICSFVDLGAIAASWNVSHPAQVGDKRVRTDLCYLQGLGSSSLLSLIAWEQRNRSPETKARVSSVRYQIMQQLIDDQQTGWTILGAYRLDQARKLLGSEFEQKVAYRNCRH